MTEQPSRLNRLVKLMGEENLPPKQTKPAPQQPQPAPKEEAEDPFKKSPSVDDVLEENSNNVTNNWWDAQPHTIAPAHTPIHHAQPTQLNDNDTHFDFDSRKGEPAPLGISFSPFLAVTKFCYKFVRRELQQPLATAFFDANKVFSREWDIYYIWSDFYPTARPLTFVPEYQFLAFLDEINAAVPQANIKITDELRDDGLVLNFDDTELKDLRPRFLGTSTCRSQYDYWTDNLPYPTSISGTMDTTDPALAAWKAKIERANELTKNKNKAKAKERQAQTVVKRQGMARSLLRVQRYLGLMPSTSNSATTDLSTLSISPASSPFHPFDSDVIFIAIDVEAWEESPRMITEVGVATLDTRDLKDCAPGRVGEDWQKHIRGRHFRIAEYKNYNNHKFVAGHPDKFDFGKSEFVGKDKIAQVLVSCFKPPFSGPGSADSQEKRQVVLVGHDISGDINMLRFIGFNIQNHSNTIFDNVDTQELYRVYTKDPNAASLANVLYAFDLMSWHLHNAGNDAVCTLWGMLAICVKAASEQGSDEGKLKEAKVLEKRTDEAVELAKERVKENHEGWELGREVEEKAVFGPQRKEEMHEEPRFSTMGGVPLDV